MKADVIHALTGISVIAVPGVNTLTQLKVMLEALRDEGVVRIRTAFDMDFTTNYHVQNGFKNLLSLLDGMGFKFGTYVWDPRYKGLDDFIWESMMDKTRGGAGKEPCSSQEKEDCVWNILLPTRAEIKLS